MLGTARKKLSVMAANCRLGLFGNAHSVKTNLRYRAYHRSAMKRWRPAAIDTEAMEAARRFAHEGWAVLPPAVDETTSAAMGRRIDALFEDPANSIEVAPGAYRLLDGVEKVPEVALYASDFVQRVVENFFRSHFKIYNISFYRTIPNAGAPVASFLWHFDNVPDEEIKLMVYFDHVSKDTGAFRFKNRELSQTLRSRGFWHRSTYPKVADLLDNESTTVVVEGKPGTTILFENGRVVHKATAPERLHRDVATFVLIPSDIPWREHFARNRHLLSTNAGLCKNPWTDEPENIGYRY
jgi:hypothetical protein